MKPTTAVAVLSMALAACAPIRDDQLELTYYYLRF
jgi:hypothetical protein